MTIRAYWYALLYRYCERRGHRWQHAFNDGLHDVSLCKRCKTHAIAV